MEGDDLSRVSNRIAADIEGRLGVKLDEKKRETLLKEILPKYKNEIGNIA
ncbi:MAG TPA: hypothetical protein PK765_05175 [bacterium]|nr:hypothetical protein [bacterium]